MKSDLMDALNVDVGHAGIDTIHQELADLVGTLASSDDQDFSENFLQLIAHTEAHFRHEEQLMADSGFVHAAEHLSEHQQMLAEMKQFSRRPRLLARAYVRDRIPERFALHITRMDSMLAAHLLEQ